MRGVPSADAVEEAAGSREGSSARGAHVVVGFSMVVCGMLLLGHFGRGQAFFYDEWELVLQRRDWDADALLTPLNEHLFLVPILVVKVMLELVGLTPHWAFHVPVVAAHLATCWLVFVLGRRRVHPWIAAGAVIVLLFLGSAWEDLLLPIQLSFVGSMAAGLGMLYVFDRGASVRHDLAACGLLTLSIASSSIGLTFAVVAAVEVLWGARYRRLWVVIAPMLAYAAWYLAYGRTQLVGGADPMANVPLVPSYIADAFAGAAGGLVGLGLEWGRILAVAGLVLLVRELTRRQGSVRLASLGAGLVSFWVLSALARAQAKDPAATRYIYVGAVFLVLIAFEVNRRRKLGRGFAAWFFCAVIAFSLVANLNLLRGGRDTLSVWSGEISARLAMLELLGPSAVTPHFRPAPELAPRLRAGDYFSSVKAFGSAAMPISGVPSESEGARRGADGVLLRGLRIALVPGGRVGTSGRVVLDQVRHGTGARSPGCVLLRPTGLVGSIAVTAPTNGVVIKTTEDGPATVEARRFADEFTHNVGTVPRLSTSTLRLPAIGPPVPWHVRVSSAGRVAVCASAGT